MPKQSGLSDRLFVGGYDLSGDINSIKEIGGGPAPWENTDITQSGVSRLGLLRDGRMKFTSYFDPAAGASHARFSALPTTDVILTYCRGTTLGNQSAAVNGKQINYDGEREDSGAFTFEVEALANGYGLEWGRQLTAGIRTDTAATNGASVDLGSVSPGAFGLQMYVHLFAFTGTSVTIKIEESSDNGVGDAWAAVVGATTAALSAVGAVRVATGLINVERYLRVVTTGTFSNAQFAVMATRNATSVVF